MTTEVAIDSTKVTAGFLKSRNISADDRTLALLPYTMLDAAEFDILDKVLTLEMSKTLSIEIGSGITYSVHDYNDEAAIDVTVKAQGDCFVFPVAISVTVSHEPQGPSEHDEFCAYSWQSWPKDENGEGYFVYDETKWKYDEENDTYFAAEADRRYEPECNCEYYVDATKEFVINDVAHLEAVTEFIEAAANGLLPEQQRQEETHDEL